MNKFLSRKIITVLLLVFTAIVIPLTVFLAKQRQEIRKGATGGIGQASLSLSPSTTNYVPGQPLTVNVMANTNGIFVSVISVRLTYNYSGSSPDITIKNFQDKSSCDLLGANPANGKLSIEISCVYASTTGTAFPSNTAIASFDITPSTSLFDPIVLEFDPTVTTVYEKSSAQNILDQSSLPSPAGTYNNQASLTPSPTTSTPTQPPASPTEPADTSPTATPTGGIGGEGNCSEVVFTSPKPGWLPKNPEKLSKNFISSAEGSVSLAKIYLSNNANWNNSDPEITLWVNNIEADQTIVLQRHTPGAWYTFTFTDTKPVVARGENILAEIQQSPTWITGASWDSSSQNQVLKLVVNCLASADTPTPSPTDTPANPTSTPPAATATPIPTTTPFNTPSPAASPTGAPPTATPEPIACSAELPTSQCVCANTSVVPSGGSAVCGQIMRKRGDFDCNGKVNMVDFEKWAISFSYRASAKDMDCDGQAGISDFNTWLTNYLNNLQ